MDVARYEKRVHLADRGGVRTDSAFSNAIDALVRGTQPVRREAFAVAPLPASILAEHTDELRTSGTRGPSSHRREAVPRRPDW